MFQDWFLKTSYYPPTLTEPSEFHSAVNALPHRKIWSVMERIKTLNGCHFFLACKQERPESSYRIDFSSATALDYVAIPESVVALVEKSWAGITANGAPVFTK